MAKISFELSEEAHQILFDLQNSRRKSKTEPTAINKIAAELLTKELMQLKKKTPDK